jgi:hypothetical protein
LESEQFYARRSVGWRQGARAYKELLGRSVVARLTEVSGADAKGLIEDFGDRRNLRVALVEPFGEAKILGSHDRRE